MNGSASQLAWMVLLASTWWSCSGGHSRASDPPVSAHALESSEVGAARKESVTDIEKPLRYSNPVLPGTHPDPSAIRVGDDYYLVVSSFEYFPGVPIYHSRDLSSWRQLGYVLTRDSQLPLNKVKSSQGVYAPTLRYHDGTFYLVTSNMTGGGSFYVTATDPRGPWSDPIWVKEDVFTMDPSLFFDDDGKVYYTRHGEQRHGAIFQAEIDIQTGKLAQPPRRIWGGTGGIWPEGPHLYKVDGTYYLLISEGGTSYEHKLTVARSPDPFGPFEPHPQNPILTHEHLPRLPIQAVGHADLLQTASGAYFMVLLGIRPSTERHHHIGRETFLAPVSWRDAWPVVNDGRPLELSMPRGNLPPPQPFEPVPVRDEFDGNELRVAWRHVRNPNPESYSLTARPGFLRLSGSRVSLDDVASPTLLVQPQTSLETTIATKVHAAPKRAEEAGLVVRGNEEYHYEALVVGQNDGQRAVLLRTRIAGKTVELARRAIPDGPVELRVTGKLDQYEFSFSCGSVEGILGAAPTTSFAYEESQSFTGAFVGLYAYSPRGDVPFLADFEWFEMASR